MNRKELRWHRLRAQIIRKMFFSFLITSFFVVIGTACIYIFTSDIDEAEEFADYAAENIPEEIENIEDIGEWSGWTKMNDEWRVEIYNEENKLIYTNGTYVMLPRYWINTERDLDSVNGKLVINAITSKKTGKYLEIFRLFDILLIILVFTLLFRKTEKYTYEISDGISILAGGEMNHRIPIKGKNELAMIADNINSMAATLQKQKKEKQISDKERDDMISNLAHDIKTPVTVLEGYLSMLIDNENIPYEKAQEYLKISLDKCNELNGRADNIFEYVRLNNKREQMNIVSVKAERYIREKFGEISMILSQEEFKFDIEINLDENAELKIDKNLIQRVFDNMLTNIVKYADKEYPVILKAYSENEKTIVMLKNKSKDRILVEPERLFERTVSGDLSRNTKSEGLGLAICRLIMEMHSGNIEAEIKDDFIKFRLCFKS